MSTSKVSSHSLACMSNELFQLYAEMNQWLPDTLRKVFDLSNNDLNSIEALINIGACGVWDSASFGRVWWYRIKTVQPIFVPLVRVMTGQRARAIEPSIYRALFLDLNNALLQLEGFE